MGEKMLFKMCRSPERCVAARTFVLFITMNPQYVLGQIIVIAGKIITFATDKKLGFTDRFWGQPYSGILTSHSSIVMKSLTLFEMRNSIEEYLMTLEMKSAIFREKMLFYKSNIL